MWWFSGMVSDAEFEETLEHRRELCAHSPKLSFRPSVLLFAGAEPPNALRRRQLCSVQDHPHYNPYIACVTRDPRQQGTSVALRWIGGRPNWDESIFTTLDQGLAWLEAKRGTPLPELREMVDSVRALAMGPGRSRA